MEELLAAAGLAATLPVAVPSYHYEEPNVERAPGAKMPLSDALSKCYDLRCGAELGGRGGRGGEEEGRAEREGMASKMALPQAFSLCYGLR